MRRLHDSRSYEIRDQSAERLIASYLTGENCSFGLATLLQHVYTFSVILVYKVLRFESTYLFSKAILPVYFSQFPVADMQFVFVELFSNLQFASLTLLLLLIQ